MIGNLEFRATRIAVFSALLVVLAGVVAVADDRVGAGRGEWHSFSGESMKGTWSVSLRTAGTELRGTMRIEGSNILRSGPISGSINGTRISFGVVRDGERDVSFSGVLDGNNVSGEWKFGSSGAGGAWFGTLVW